MRYLCDTNTIIDYLAVRFNNDALVQVREIVNTNFCISVITKIEVLGFTSSENTLDIKTEQFVELAEIFELTSAVVNQTIEIRKEHKIKIADAIIAATAIVNDFTLLTHNLKDFTKINGLSVVDPHAF